MGKENPGKRRESLPGKLVLEEEKTGCFSEGRGTLPFSGPFIVFALKKSVLVV